MPAWLRHVLIVPLAMLVTGLTWVAWSQRGGLVLSALQRRIPLQRPVSVTLDGRGGLDHGDDEYPFDTHLLTLQVHDGHLSFDVRGEESVGLWRVPLAGGEPRLVLDVAAPSEEVYNLAGFDTAGLFVASYSGDRVFRLGPEGGLVDAGRHPARPEVPALVLADKTPTARSSGRSPRQCHPSDCGCSSSCPGWRSRDVVNLASRLEGLTKVYSARIIVSDQVIRKLEAGAPDHRYLGDAEVKGKRAEVPVHEVFAADPEEDVRRKRHTRGFFETGVGLFRQSERRHQAGFRVEALRYFRAVAKAHPEDRAAAYYLAACSRTVTPTGVPETPGAG